MKTRVKMKTRVEGAGRHVGKKKEKGVYIKRKGKMARGAHQRENPVGAAVPLHEVSGGEGTCPTCHPTSEMITRTLRFAL